MRLLVFILLLASFFRPRAGGADTVLLKKHLEALVIKGQYRNYQNLTALDSAARYIYSTFALFADSVFFQGYEVAGKKYYNVVARFNKKERSSVVVGAHYDVCENQDGADDNASGVAGLLELARLLKETPPACCVELVAYTLEEPPFFRTTQMGSYRHALSLYKEKRRVLGMVSLEMIGYFKEEKNSQQYPIGFLKWFYGSRGNYITLVKKYGSGRFCRRFSRRFIATRSVRTKKFSGLRFLPGVDFSDHLNYWKFGYRALMITDTSFYRNKNYHDTGDTLNTLDIGKMARVINATFYALNSMK